MLALRNNLWLPSLVVVALLATAAPGSMMYSGSLSTAGGGLVGTGPWGTGPSTLEWTVEVVDGPIWEYSYTLTVPQKAISHMILELSLDFMDENLESLLVNGAVASGEIDEYGPGDPSNPMIPDDIYGIKVEGFDDALEVTVVLRTLRDPVWGDFYAKDGADPGTGDFVAIWNAGFTFPDTDPLDFPDDGALDGHLLVPDQTEIPEPVTLAMLAAGGMALTVLRRSR